MMSRTLANAALEKPESPAPTIPIPPVKLQPAGAQYLPGLNGFPDVTNQLVVGDVFAVWTSDGNYAKVQVVEYGYNLQIRFVTLRP